MVELAIALPFLILLVLGAVDFGVLMGQSSSLESAARAGAEVGKISPSVSGTNLVSLGLIPSGANTPTVTSVCSCVDGTWPGGTCPPGPFDTPCSTVKNPFVTGTPVDPRWFVYVEVSATQDYNQIVTYAGLGSLPTSMAAQAFTRIQ
jgi:hypothetical protein